MKEITEKIVNFIINDKSIPKFHKIWFLNLSDNDENTPLILACKNNLECISKKLIDYGVDVNVKNIKGETPLIMAIKNGNINIVKSLIDKMANLNDADNNENTPVHWACICNKEDILQLLLENNASFKMDNKFYESPIILASKNKNFNIIKKLFFWNREILCPEDLLIFSILLGSDDNVKILFDSGINIDIKYGQRMVSPLLLAVQVEQIKIVDMLIKLGVNIQDDDAYGNTALIYSCINGNKQIFNLLINETPFIRQKNKFSNTALHWACYQGHKEMVEYLLNRNIDKNDFLTSPLIKASINNHEEIVKLIIENKEIFGNENKNFINSSNRLCESSIFFTCKNGSYNLTKYLIDNGADINTSNNNQSTPFIVACKYGHLEIVKLLVENKANYKYKDKDGNSGFAFACMKGYTDIIIYLLSLDKDDKYFINDVNEDKYNSIIHACMNNNRKIVQILLNNGANVNERISYDMNILMYSVIKGFNTMSELLIDYGASIQFNDYS
eukprot:jgi/Orpsp1_1/1185776/evm.model.c7180000095194.1